MCIIYIYIYIYPTYFITKEKMALGQFLNKAVNWISKYLEIGKDKGVNKVLGKPTRTCEE